jgi:RNA polymerase sigma-70 factor (ECF subfamily)
MQAVRMSSPPSADLEHAELVRAAQSGDRDALRRLLAELLPRARNLVRYLVRTDPDVDDIVQEALLTVVRRIGTYRAEGPIAAWADRLVVRTTFAELRRRRRQREVEPVADAASAGTVGLPDEYLLRRRVVAALDDLPEAQRHAVVLHHVLEMNVHEVAAELGVPAETVRSRLRLARAKLRVAGFVVDPADRPEGGLS